MKMVSRKEWGAAVPKSRTRIATPVPRLWLHHTGSTADNGGRTVRAIQQFHMAPKPHGRGWQDIAYNWLYSPSTREFYEGRGAGVAGGHTQGDNTRSHALCVLGNYDVQRPPEHVIHDLRAFLRWHGSYGPTRFTGGHRDAPGASTSCPGRHLYALLPDLQTTPPLEDDMTDDQDRLLRHIHDHVTNSQRSGGLRHRVTDTHMVVGRIDHNIRRLVAGAAVGGASAGAIVTEIANRLAG